MRKCRCKRCRSDLINLKGRRRVYAISGFGLMAFDVVVEFAIACCAIFE
jgi:hypothetical protein